MESSSWKEKHEELLHKTLKEFEESTLVAQKAAEKNAEASSKLIAELRAQLQQSQEKVKTLEEKLKEAKSPSIVSIDTVDDRRGGSGFNNRSPISISSGGDSGSENQHISASVQKKRLAHKTEKQKRNQIMNFFESITCLNVNLSECDDDSVTYHCSLEDGQLMGHEFKIKLSYDNWEYTYTPLKISRSLKKDSQFKISFFFPDFMLPRFLGKLLDETYPTDEDQ